MTELNPAGNHADAWAAMVPLFDEQLAECQNANYEFSTLAGAYIAQIYYMSMVWCERNFAKVFPKEARELLTPVYGSLRRARNARSEGSEGVIGGVGDLRQCYRR